MTSQDNISVHFTGFKYIVVVAVGKASNELYTFDSYTEAKSFIDTLTAKHGG